MTTTTLKLIALALMFIDHIGEFIPGMPAFFRILGRASAPVFIFCTVWGFHYTHSRKVYLIRMYICSALMGILDMALNLSVFQPVTPCYNNIFSTLFIICMFISLWEKGDRPWKKALWVLAYLALNIGSLLLANLVVAPSLYGLLPQEVHAACYTAVSGVLPNAVTCEGSYLVVLMGLVLYGCKGSKKKLCWGYGLYCGLYLGLLVYLGLTMPSNLSGGNWMDFLFRDAVQWLQALALPLMLLYNGQRGRNLKYLFYVFYPLHIVFLFYMGYLLSG